MSKKSSIHSVCEETQHNILPSTSQDTEPELLPKRIGKSTWKVTENYESNRLELSASLKLLWDKVLTKVSSITQPVHEVLQLEGAIEQLTAVFKPYKSMSTKYESILLKINTEDSLEELENLRLLNLERDSFYLQTKTKAESKLAQLQDTASHSSASTKHSKRSSRSSQHSKYSTLSEQLVNARAEAEAIKVQAIYATKRVEIDAEAAEMEALAAAKRAEMEALAATKRAEMEALKEQCNYDAAMARLKVLEQAVGTSERGSINLSVVDVEDPFKRTKNYVLSQSSEHSIPPELPDNPEISSEHQDREVPETSNLQEHRNALPTFPPVKSSNIIVHQTNLQASHQPLANSTVPAQRAIGATDSKPAPRLNPLASPYLPTSVQHQPENSFAKSEQTDGAEFVKYILRRELTKTGLIQFDDQPENYRSWKCAFQTAINDLGITATEELDLLFRWLGPQSSECIKSLRSVYINNPMAGLTAAWERLDQSFGSPEAIENALFKQLEYFPRISGKDNREFQKLSDLLLELQLAKADPNLPGLSYLDTARGVIPIVSKLPYALQNKWATLGSKYKRENKVSFPPFSYFCEFIRNIAETKNDPSFSCGEFNISSSPLLKCGNLYPSYKNRRGPVSVKKTDVLPTPTSAPDTNSQSRKIENPNRLCPIHKKPHPLKKCIGFRKKPLQERKELLKTFGVCFRCCASTEHFAKDCKFPIKCIECGCEDHVQALHPLQSSPAQPASSPPMTRHGGESTDQATHPTTISSSCTEVCGENLCDKSCAKICLVNVYHKDRPEKTFKVYAILDDQSNRSLARTELFELFNIKGEVYPYTLGTCSGVAEASGRRAYGLVISSFKKDIELPLPTLVECNQIPANKEEIPTPEAAFYHPHLKAIAKEIPPLDKNAQILLLLGRDILRVHKVHKQVSGPPEAPFAQRLDLGWVIIGNVCIGKMKKPNNICSYKTHVLPNGRGTYFEPCPHHYWVKEKISDCKWQHDNHDNVNTFPSCDDNIGSTVFNLTSEDDVLAPSVEDKEFLKVMDKEFSQDGSNSWVAPLPFRFPRKRLPNNLQQAVARFSSLKRTLNKKPEMEKHFVNFMQNIFDRDHAEPAPPLKEGEECWYLPSFGVYHPRKPDKIRVVFDSSAQHEGVSINKLLLTGPNLINSLMGVLIRFRQEPVAVMADIEQMFHCFIVREDNRNFLRFLWHKDNDINNEVIDYRMKVHVFGNSPSPAVAIYGLRKTAQIGEAEYGSDARQFVEKNFYVDDGLKSFPTAEEAIDLLTRTKEMLSVANLRLHKIISNSRELMDAFPSEDYADNLKDLDLGSEIPPMQRSLGLLWNIKQDTFTFQVSSCSKPFTKRGVLSVVNSIYDPLGFVAPVTIQGKILLRQLSTEKMDWDTPLPSEKQHRWEKWRQSLKSLEQLQIPRCYAPTSISTASRNEIHVFSDASVEAIAAVAYLKTSGTDR